MVETKAISVVTSPSGNKETYPYFKEVSMLSSISYHANLQNQRILDPGCMRGVNIRNQLVSVLSAIVRTLTSRKKVFPRQTGWVTPTSRIFLPLHIHKESQLT